MKTTLFASVSIDGFIADASGIPMFPPTSWPNWCARTNTADGLIAGRASVEQIVQHGMAGDLTLPHKLMLSSRDESIADWKPVASPAEALATLKQAGANEVIVGGGRSVYHAFMQAGLVDAVVLDLQPVAFGKGVPLFGDTLDPTTLTLTGQTPLNQNTLRLTYRVERSAT